jgi:hypothetical protein
MPGPSSTVTIRPLHPSLPNCLHMPTAGSTIHCFNFVHMVIGQYRCCHSEQQHWCGNRRREWYLQHSGTS